MDEASLEGWTPEPRDADELAEVIDFAFDYRGDVTVVLKNGEERVGYIFNRRRGADASVELLEPSGTAPVAIRNADIRTIRFSGKDMASVKSYAAWLERKKAGRPSDGR